MKKKKSKKELFYYFQLAVWGVSLYYLFFQHDYISNCMNSYALYQLNGILMLMYIIAYVYMFKTNKAHFNRKFEKSSKLKKIIAFFVTMLFVGGMNYLFISVVVPRYITLYTETSKTIIREVFVESGHSKECYSQLFLKGYDRSIFQHTCIDADLFNKIRFSKEPIYAYVKIKENSFGTYIGDIFKLHYIKGMS